MFKHINVFKTLVVFLVLVVLGAFVIPKLSVRLNPSDSPPSISVNFSWLNSSPYALEREITSVLEGGFSIIEGLTSLNSKSSKGSGNIILTFDKHTNIDNARFEVAKIIRQLYKKLPDRVSYPVISVNKPNDDENQRAFLSYSINAMLSPSEIQEIVKNKIEPVIGSLKGVEKTTIYGATPKEYVINFDAQLLKKLTIKGEDIIKSLRQKFTKKSLGNIFYKNEYITLSVDSKEEMNWHIPIKKINDRIIYLNHIASIKKRDQEVNSYFRVNGKNSITLSVYAEKNANTLVLSKQVAKELDWLKEQLPKDFSIIEAYNATEYLETELDKIYERSIYTVAILLIFILLISRSFKYLLITVLCFISNLGIALLLYYLFKVEIHLYSLAGITISLGLIIDNSIVMIDHIKKQGNTNAFIPILASTLTTVGALTIIYFLDDKYKLNLIDFALVIVINLMVSLFVALFFIPALLSKLPFENTSTENKLNNLIKRKFYEFYEKILKFLLRFKKLAIIAIILLFGIPFFMLPQKLENNKTFLEKTYNLTIGNDWFRENLRPNIDKYLGGSFRLFNYYVFDNAYYNKNEETKLYVTASMEKGATVHQMNEVFLVLESDLQQFSEIKKYTTAIYSGDQARMEISFKDDYQFSSFPFVLKARLIRKALDLGGIDWNVYGVGNGFNSSEGNTELVNFTVEAKGYNYDNLNSWGDTLKNTLLKHPRIEKVIVKENSYWSKKRSYEYLFTMNKELISLLKRNPSALSKELKALTLSKQSDISLNLNGKYIPVRLESNESKKFDIWHIKNTPLDSVNKPLVIKSLVEIKKIREEENIYKENQEYIRLVQFQYTGSAKFGSKFLDKKLKELDKKLPLGYKFERLDNKWFLSNDKNNYTFLFVLVLLIIYFICAILFESLKQPFVILSVIPISFIGVFLTFYLFDFNFDQGGLASFVLLSGITVNASIFILNEFNKLKKEQPKEKYVSLYILAFKQKIFPIALTILSTILGFIPFVKDGQNEVFWFALGAGTIGGLIFSLIGILFYLPIFNLNNRSSRN